MGEHVRIEVPAPPAGAPSPTFGALVGWTHRESGSGIDLSLQSASSQAALRAGAIDTTHLLMTRNQALLLARYLLIATGQLDDLTERPHGWRAGWSRLRRR